MNIKNTLFVSVFTIFAAGHAAAQLVNFDLTGGNDTTGGLGASYTETTNGRTLTVNGYTHNGTSFQNGYVSQWSPGLGMQLPASANDANHQLDNVGTDELFLFKFNTKLTGITLSFNPASGTTAVDGDVSYWLGNTAANVNLHGVTTTQLTGLGFQQVQTSTRGNGTSSFSVALANIPAGGVNTILFGGPLGQDDDVYKVSGVSGTVVPEPTGILLVGSAGLLALARRRRR